MKWEYLSISWTGNYNGVIGIHSVSELDFDLDQLLRSWYPEGKWEVKRYNINGSENVDWLITLKGETEGNNLHGLSIDQNTPSQPKVAWRLVNHLGSYGWEAINVNTGRVVPGGDWTPYWYYDAYFKRPLIV